MENANYTVESYTITRDRADAANGWSTWDDQSGRDVSAFGTEEEARAFFSEVDVRRTWLAECMSAGSTASERKVMACELCRNELDEDGEAVESEIVEYKEFGAADRAKEQDHE